MNKEQFNRLLKEKFGGKYTVAYWETIPSDDGKDMVIRVGLKKADLTLAEAQELPTEIDGVKMVYEYSGEIELLTTKYYEPLIGGVSIGAIDVTAGTYGGVVYDKDTKEPYFLTNEHVVSDTQNNDLNHPPVGHPIIQPGAIDGGTDVAGNLVRVGGMKQAALSGLPCDIDAALIQPVRSFHATKYFELGNIEALKHAPAKIGDKIVKVGRTTGVTYAEVGAVEVSANISGISWSTPVVMENLIMTKESFVQGGDSGSRVWEVEQMQPVGLVFAGSWLTSMIIPAGTICNSFGVVFGEEEPDLPESKSCWKKFKGGENMLNTEFGKEFWIAVITAVLVVLNQGLGLGIPEETVWPVVLLILGWIFKNGVVEAVVKSAIIKAEGTTGLSKALNKK